MPGKHSVGNTRDVVSWGGAFRSCHWSDVHSSQPTSLHRAFHEFVAQGKLPFVEELQK